MFYYRLEHTSLMIPILLVKQFNNIKLLKMDSQPVKDYVDQDRRMTWAISRENVP